MNIKYNVQCTDRTKSIQPPVKITKFLVNIVVKS